ncbi:MAG: hypothetical protein GF350_06395 [Chitinivibrionales bacterium]|nr:hypothetical protein [Chitinivibrionales bacterium]
MTTKYIYEDEVKPCPFCGRAPAISENWDMVYCKNQECPLCSYPVFLKGWNMRRWYEEDDYDYK